MGIAVRYGRLYWTGADVPPVANLALYGYPVDSGLSPVFGQRPVQPETFPTR
jgi:hypothetical protein